MTLLALAGVALKEALRESILSVAALLTVVLITATTLMSAAGPENSPVLTDFGLGAMRTALPLLAAFLGARLISGDLERRVVYVLFSKPIGRGTYLVGKYLGAAAGLLLVLAAMSAGLAVALASAAGHLEWRLLVAVSLLGVEAMVALALALLFGVLTSPTLAFFYTMGLVLMGRNSELIRNFGMKEGGFAEAFSALVFYGLPNFSVLDLSKAIAYGGTLRMESWLFALAYGLSAAVALLALAATVFEGRELP